MVKFLSNEVILLRMFQKIPNDYKVRDWLKENPDRVVVVTEKIDGTQFRIKFGKYKDAYDYEIEYGSHRRRIDDPSQFGYSAEIPNSVWEDLIVEMSKHVFADYYINRRQSYSTFQVVGELAGGKIQSGKWKWKFDGYKYFVFAIYVTDSTGSYVISYNQMVDIVLRTITGLKENGKDQAAELLSYVPAYGFITAKDVDEMANPNDLSSVVASGTPEGVVIHTENKFVSRGDDDAIRYDFIMKWKSDAYMEKKSVKKSLNGNKYSYILQYITPERVSHAIERLKEDGVELKNDMEDMKYIASYVFKDIIEEEHLSISQEDINHAAKLVSKHTARVYLNMLRSQAV
jgi:hypothetical protein